MRINRTDILKERFNKVPSEPSESDVITDIIRALLELRAEFDELKAQGETKNPVVTASSHYETKPDKQGLCEYKVSPVEKHFTKGEAIEIAIQDADAALAGVGIALEQVTLAQRDVVALARHLDTRCRWNDGSALLMTGLNGDIKVNIRAKSEGEK